MENQNVKRGRGRPIIYDTEQKRKAAVTRSKTNYMLNKEWFCNICNNGINYKLAGKHCHLKTKKHLKNKNELI